MTIPWKLKIVHVDSIPRLVGLPVPQVDQLMKGKSIKVKSQEEKLPGNSLAHLQLTSPKDNAFSFELSNEQNESVSFSYDGEQNFYLDRTKAGDHSFSNEFSGTHLSKRISYNENISVSAFIDHSSIEIFLDNGMNNITGLVFPSSPFNTITFSESLNSSTISITEMKGIW